MSDRIAVCPRVAVQGTGGVYPVPKDLRYSDVPAVYNHLAAAKARCKRAGDWTVRTYKLEVCADWAGRGGWRRMLEHVGMPPHDGAWLTRLCKRSGWEPGNVAWASVAGEDLTPAIVVIDGVAHPTRPPAECCKGSGCRAEVVEPAPAS
jgi:hypothetical protein